MTVTDEMVEAAYEALCDNGIAPEERTRAALEAAVAVAPEAEVKPLLDPAAVEEAIATKVMHYDSGTAVHEVDDNDLAGLVAGADAVMALAVAAPTFSEIKAAIRTGLGGDTEEGCGCESHICSAADAVLSLVKGEEK